MIPLIRKLNIHGEDMVMVQYSQTLVQFIPVKLWNKLVDAYEIAMNDGGADISIPIWSYYRRKGRSTGFTVLGPLKIQGELERAGAYIVYITDEMTTFGNVDIMGSAMVAASAKLDAIAEYLSKIETTIKITDIPKSAKFLEYEAVNGAVYELIHLPSDGTVGIGRVLHGPSFHSDIAVVFSKDKLEEGETVTAKLLYAKAGRADFAKSKHSHQVGIYLVL